MISEYLGDIERQLRKERKETILKMYLQCYTAQEIADVVGLTQQGIDLEIQSLQEMEPSSKTCRTANFQDDFKQPIYNLWGFGKTTNKTEHFGQTEQRIV